MIPVCHQADQLLCFSYFIIKNSVSLGDVLQDDPHCHADGINIAFVSLIGKIVSIYYFWSLVTRGPNQFLLFLINFTLSVKVNICKLEVFVNYNVVRLDVSVSKPKAMMGDS